MQSPHLDLRVSGTQYRRSSSFYMLSPAYPAATLSLFALNLSYLLRAGLPLSESLSLMINIERSSRFRAVIKELRRSVHGGSSLSRAMRQQPTVFTHVSAALVEAAERHGDLDNAFSHIAQLITLDAQSKETLRSALAYPIILCVAVVATLLFMMAYLIPVLEPLLQSMGVEPSLITRSLFWLSTHGGVVSRLVIMLFAIVLFIVFVSIWVVSVRLWLHRVVLQCWIIGDIKRDQLYARFTRVLAQLLDSGLNMDEALLLASNCVDNANVNHELHRLRSQIQVGDGFSDSIKRLSTAPKQLAPLLKAAEASGEVAKVLLSASQQLDEQATARLQRFTAIVPPALICVLGLVLLALVSGLLAPIFGSAIMMGVTV